MPPFIFANTPFNRIPKIKKQPNRLKMMMNQILKNACTTHVNQVYTLLIVILKHLVKNGNSTPQQYHQI